MTIPVPITLLFLVSLPGVCLDGRRGCRCRSRHAAQEMKTCRDLMPTLWPPHQPYGQPYDHHTKLSRTVHLSIMKCWMLFHSQKICTLLQLNISPQCCFAVGKARVCPTKWIFINILGAKKSTDLGGRLSSSSRRKMYLILSICPFTAYSSLWRWNSLNI